MIFIYFDKFLDEFFRSLQWPVNWLSRLAGFDRIQLTRAGIVLSSAILLGFADSTKMAGK
jgi:hypothetical protein